MSGFAIPFVEDEELSPNTEKMLALTPAGTAPTEPSFLQSHMKKKKKKPKPLTKREKMDEDRKLRQLQHFYPQESGRYSPITIGLKEGRVFQEARARSPLFAEGIKAEKTEKKLKKWKDEGTTRWGNLNPNNLTDTQKKILKSPKKKGLQPHELAQAKPPPLNALQQMWKRIEDRNNTAATKIQAKIRGNQTRKKMGKKKGGSKTRKKSKRFRNNLRKNKISRKYIMLKQCGGGKAKMGSKSKPYSSKRKAMKSRRRVCYYKKKGRTLKMKKKKKKSRKKSRRRR